MRIVAAVVAVLAALVSSSVVLAGGGTSGSGGLVVVDEVRDIDSEPTPEPAVECTTREAQSRMHGRYTAGGYTYMYVDGRAFRVDQSSAHVWVRTVEMCEQDGTVVSTRIAWTLLTDPDPELVAATLRDRAEREVLPPVPDLSPAGRGVVNVGMWLAVADPGVYEATATAAPGSWVTARAALVETSFDMGNGDVVTCRGAGDPIPESAFDSVEASPVCGYVYRRLHDGGPYTLTITSRWDVTRSSSRGTSGTQPPIVTSTTIDYEVLEIQTVGGPAGG